MSMGMSMELVEASNNEEEHDGGSFSSSAGMTQLVSPPSALRELPALRDEPPNKREELFKLKLQLCGVIFSFDDPTSDKRGKVCAMSARTFHFCVLFESYHCLCVVRSENTR